MTLGGFVFGGKENGAVGELVVFGADARGHFSDRAAGTLGRAERNFGTVRIFRKNLAQSPTGGRAVAPHLHGRLDLGGLGGGAGCLAFGLLSRDLWQVGRFRVGVGFRVALGVLVRFGLEFIYQRGEHALSPILASRI